jgi:multiple sugar transport system substrate-binding protein
MKKLFALILSLFVILSFVLPSYAITSVPVTGIKLDSKSINMKPGQTYTLNITLTPANTTQKLLTFSTSDSDVAMVTKSGKIVGVNPGKATITVHSQSNQKISAKCTIVVADRNGEVNVLAYNQRTRDSLFGPLYNDFTKATGIKVNVLPVTGDGADYMRKVDIALMSGDTFDVFFVGNQIDHTKYVLNKSLLELSDFAKNYQYDLNTKYGKYLLKFSGQVYGIPGSPSYWAVFYNKKIFDDAKVPYPKGYWTWDQYVETAKKLTNPEKKIYGSFMNTFDANNYILANQKGVNGYKPDGTSNFDDPAFIDSIKFYGSLGNTLKVQPSFAEQSSKKLPAESFVSGNYAMQFCGSWLLSQLSDRVKYPRDWDYGITQVPVPDASSKNNVGAIGFVQINKNAKNKDNAFRLATFIGENQYKYTNEIPALADFDKDDFLKLFEQGAKDSGGSVTAEDLYNALINNGLGFRPEKITGSIPAQYKAIIVKEVQLYYLGQKSAEDVCKSIKEQADAEIMKLKQNK